MCNHLRVTFYNFRKNWYSEFLTRKTFNLNHAVKSRLSKYLSDHRPSVFQMLSEMPKQVNRTELKNVRHGKHALTVARQQPAAEIYLQVVGNGAKGTARSVYMFTDQWRYLFNCGEGTQRLANEYKTRLSKLEHIFFTYGSWENIGGFPGLILTIQNIGVPKISIHGPTGIEKLFDMTKGFMLTEDIAIDKRCVEDGSYQDHIMSVTYVPLYGSGREVVNLECIEDCNEVPVDYYDNQRLAKKMNSTSPSLEQARKKKKLSQQPNAAEDRETSIAYICKCTNKPGQLLLDKCVDFGVPPGPLLGQLKSGKDVTLPNGKIVRSVDVLSPEDPGPVFIVVECPTVAFLDSLLESERFQNHQASASNEEDIAKAVIHFTPAEVTKSEKYQQWILRFHPSTEHLFVNDSNTGPSSLAVHRIQHKLHLLHPTIFPLLQEELTNATTDCTNVKSETSRSAIIHHCGTMFKYNLRPHKKSDRPSQVSINVKEFHDECMKAPGFPEALSELKSNMGMCLSSATAKKYPEIVFLGTGSSIPSKVRNTSSILLNLSSDKSLLMDCGEGTVNQLCNFYGKAEVNHVLQRIQAVFISHLHADHHIGLIGLLKQRHAAFKELSLDFFPVELLAPKQIMYWLWQYHITFEPILQLFSLLPNTSVQLGTEDCDHENYGPLLKKLTLKQLKAIPVKHCRHAFGITLTHTDGWKLVYSGDTMPCDSLVNEGMDCDLLIHEATMEDDLADEAVIKRHSTTMQAIEQGVKMNAKFTLLTHFSQRYAKVPLFTNNFGSDVGIAFDNLKVCMSELHILPYLTPALKAMFAEHYEEMQEKTAKKMRQRAKEEAAATFALAKRQTNDPVDLLPPAT